QHEDADRAQSVAALQHHEPGDDRGERDGGDELVHVAQRPALGRDAAQHDRDELQPGAEDDERDAHAAHALRGRPRSALGGRRRPVDGGRRGWVARVAVSAEGDHRGAHPCSADLRRDRTVPTGEQRRRLGCRGAGARELPAVQHHREDVDADRGHVEAVAVERELHQHQLSLRASRSARRRSNSSPYPARSVRASPPISTTARPSPEGVILAQNRRRRTVSEHSSPPSSAIAKTSTTSSAGSWLTCRLTHWPTPSKRTTVPSSRRRLSPGSRLARATFTSAPESTLPWSTLKIDWPRPSSRPRSPRSTSTATCGSSGAGNTEVTTSPPDVVGASSPVMARPDTFRSATPGRWNFVAPSDSIVVASTGLHWVAPVRCCPSGNVT